MTFSQGLDFSICIAGSSEHPNALVFRRAVSLSAPAVQAEARGQALPGSHSAESECTMHLLCTEHGPHLQPELK